MPAAKFFVDQPWYPSIPCQCTTTAPFSMVTLVSWCTWLPPKLWATISNTWGEWGGEAGCGNKNPEENLPNVYLKKTINRLPTHHQKHIKSIQNDWHQNWYLLLCDTPYLVSLHHATCRKKTHRNFRQKAIAVFLYLHFSTPRSPYVSISHPFPIPFCLAPWFFFG